MNRTLKQKLKKAFEVRSPDRQEKNRFLQTLARSQISISTRQFVIAQFFWLRKRILLLSLLFPLPALAGARHMNPNTLWVLSALIPFLGLLAVAESTRSATYGMQELEMSARFSLKSVVLARMSILGLLDGLVICCLIPLCRGGNLSLLQTGIYLLVPYLLTVNASLWLTRRFHGREGLYGCMCAAVLVSVGNFGLHLIADFIYQFSYIHWWIILSASLLGRMAWEICQTMKTTEELT